MSSDPDDLLDDNVDYSSRGYMKLLASILHLTYNGQEFSALTTWIEAEGMVMVQLLHILDVESKQSAEVTTFKTYAESHQEALSDVISMMTPLVEDYLA